MGARQAIATPVEGVRRYGRSVLRGDANFGRCLICDRRTLFVETSPDLNNGYRCVRCHSIPRWRAIIYMLNTQFPQWRDLTIHECGAGGPATRKLIREASGYSGSRYLLPDAPRGTVVGRFTCQDIEDLTFPDDSFDLVVTQDVLEHVLQPDRAVAELARVLRPGGAHVFTVPVSHGRETLVRVAPKGDGVEYLLPPSYHGDPGDPDKSLVMREWGDDFVEFVAEHSGMSTKVHPLHDRRLGLDGNPFEVFVSRK